MKANNDSQTYAIFFSNLEESSEIKRIALLKKFTADGLSSTIEVQEDFIFEQSHFLSAIIIVKASNKEVIEESLKPCIGTFSYKVTAITSYQKDSSIAFANQCVAIGGKDLTEISIPDHIAVRVKAKIDLPEDSPYSCLFLLQVDAIHKAHEFATALNVDNAMHINEVTHMTDYFEYISNKKEESSYPQIVNQIDNRSTTSTTIENKGSAAYYADVASPVEYINLVSDRHPIASGSKVPSRGKNYFWKSLSGKIEYKIGKRRGQGQFANVYYSPASIDTNCPFPVASESIYANENLEFNLNTKDNFHITSDFYTKLHGILNTKNYDDHWPEENYEEGSDRYLVYAYILEQLKIRGYKLPPNQGTLKADLISQITYPQDQSFSEDAFKEVSDHLRTECDYFEESAKWYGPKGIMSAITETIAEVSTDDLIAAAGYMSVPPETSKLTLFLEVIFKEITSIISVIPDIGSPIAGVISAGMSTITEILKMRDESTSIEASIADMALKLTDYLAILKEAQDINYKEINGNWGKLKRFALFSINKEITADHLGVTFSKQGSIAPESFVKGLAKAWRIIIYKNLFQTIHKAGCTMNTTKTIPAPNPFNPSKNQYSFTYYLKGSFSSVSDKVVDGYITFTCSSNAPKEALHDLFSPDRLDQDPIPFFFGLNGWPKVKPYFYNSDNGDPIIKRIFI
ncbi:hypothetical protein [uncultured Dokdonia sp.]|uniref:hypothetical protein n=1 Tax=uncultured Dokdonia sp. TaxID=575653 RepID=UPI00261585F0|nr:hypothetical protein [uncultured Dokdonia sp.]